MWNICRNSKYKAGIGFASLALAAMVCSSALAQVKPYMLAARKDTNTFLFFNSVTAGPYVTAGISRQNEDIPAGWHSASRFAYTIGGTIDLSVNPWIGIDLTALYDSRDLYLATQGDSQSIDLNLGYIALEPSIRLFWLLVGLVFDIPMSGSATVQLPYPADKPYAANMNMRTGDINGLTEAQATLSIPVLEGDGSMLHLIIRGSYPLSKVLGTTMPSYDTTANSLAPTAQFSGSNAAGQGPLPTIEAGISYQFDLLR